MKTHEVATFLSVSKSAVVRWRTNGRGEGPPFTVIGGEHNYDQVQVEQWLAAHPEKRGAAPRILAPATAGFWPDLKLYYQWDSKRIVHDTEHPRRLLRNMPGVLEHFEINGAISASILQAPDYKEALAAHRAKPPLPPPVPDYVEELKKSL